MLVYNENYMFCYGNRHISRILYSSDITQSPLCYGAQVDWKDVGVGGRNENEPDGRARWHNKRTDGGRGRHPQWSSNRQERARAGGELAGDQV